jgi:hypothetical protein
MFEAPIPKIVLVVVVVLVVGCFVGGDRRNIEGVLVAF